MKTNPFLSQITVSGRNCAKVLNALKRRGISIRDVKVQENAFSFCIAKKDIEKTFAILKKLCYTYTVKECVSAKTVVKTLLKKTPLILALSLSLLFIAIFSTTFLGIKTDGTKEQEQKVLALLEKDGIKIGSNVNDIDLKKFTPLIEKECAVASCSVKKQGNYLVIRFLPTHSEQDKTVKYDSVVSTCDAIVTSVIAQSGTAKVKVGDVVKVGDELISGTVKAQNGEDEIITRASGIVWGKVYYSKSEVISPNATVLVKTGKSKTFTYLSIFARKDQSPPYKVYTQKREKSIFNVFFPITYEKVTYEEMQERNVELDIELYAKETLSKLKEDSGLIINDEGYEIARTSDGRYLLTTYLVTEKIISKGV